jgi:outer membrane cobalamin receptor
VFQFRNVQSARVRGLDLGWKNTLVPGLADLDVTYLYLDASDTQTGQWLPYRSRHNVTATLDILRGLAGVDVRYRSRVESVLVYPLDRRSDFTVVDLRANAPLLGTIVQARIGNVFNRFYTDVQERTPGTPRHMSLGVLATF